MFWRRLRSSLWTVEDYPTPVRVTHLACAPRFWLRSRPEDGIKSLPRIAAEAVGRDIAEVYANADKGVLEDVQLLQQVCVSGGFTFISVAVASTVGATRQCWRCLGRVLLVHLTKTPCFVCILARRWRLGFVEVPTGPTRFG